MDAAELRCPERAPMTVLMTADTVGGVFTYAVELAGALARSRVRVALATMGGPPSQAQRRALESLPNVTLYESSFRLEWMDAPWDDVEAAGAWLMDVNDRVRPDVVHLNNFAHGALGWSAPVIVGGHSCVLSWWEAVRGELVPGMWDRYQHVVARGLRAADAVFAPTRAMLAALQRHYGPLPPACVIPNGRSGRTFQPAQKEPFVLAAGRVWDEAKGIASLAAVAADLDWPVRIAGEAAHPDSGTAAFSNVEMLGRLPTRVLSAEMSRASIYALPARYEPFGLSALEAGLSGCALVLGDIPSLREVWGEAALFVRDEDELRRALRRLIAEPALRADYAARALRRAATYTPARMADATLQLYRRVQRRALPQGDGASVPTAANLIT